MLRAITIAVIIGTFLMGTYYVVAASYVQPLAQDTLNLALDKLRPGLTYDKFVSIEESQRVNLVQQMPSSTITMLVQEARNHPSFIAEKADDIRAQTGSSEIKVLKLTKIFGLKGFNSQGESAIIKSGERDYLRLQEFGVTAGIDQHIYLTKDVTVATGIDVGRLKASQGDQYYDITGINTDVYTIMTIYSPTFDTYYAHAKFLKSE